MPVSCNKFFYSLFHLPTITKITVCRQIFSPPAKPFFFFASIYCLISIYVLIKRQSLYREQNR